jgi:DNA (cytosine-5)-methyltransferase 1
MGNDAAELFARIALTADELSRLLNISVEQAAKYVDGEIRPAGRHLNVLKGLVLASGSSLPRANRDSLLVTKSKKSSKTKTNNRRALIHSGPRRLRNSDLTTLELCAGGGGAALGLERAGFHAQALLDIDPHACATLRKNRPYWNVVQADLQRFDASYWRGVDLLSGGLPCPPFSIAGKQLGPNDERDLFPHMLRIVDEVEPRAVLIENVRPILSERFAGYREKINAELRKRGLESYWMVFNAAEFGVPQSRFRAFLIALRKGETKPLRWPLPMPNAGPTVGESIADIMGSRGWKGVDEWARKANSPAPTIVGGSHKHGGPDLGPTRARREWAALGVDGLGIADTPPEADFRGMPRLTIPMVARLQSFPDDWIFAGSKTHAYRQVGNALPVQLAYAMARTVRECLL